VAAHAAGSNSVRLCEKFDRSPGGHRAAAFRGHRKVLDELTARIARSLDYIQSVRPDAFAGAEDRDVKIPLPSTTLEFKGLNYLREFALPNFYFHLVMAYAILRHNGVELTKRDYLTMS
jgi:uncharacterized protein